MSKARTCLSISLAAIGFAIVLAACGSSSTKSSGSPAASSNQGVAFAECMRAHGLTNFPDPGSGGGIQFSQGSGINPQSPGFQTAQKACGHLLPGGGPGSIKPTEHQKELAIQDAQCMRAHGLSNFPDPTLTPPTPTGSELVFGRAGMFFVLGPGINPQSPAFESAAAKCGIPVPRAGKVQAVG
jgi:hypothetical protein